MQPGSRAPALELHDDSLAGVFHSLLFSRAKSPGPGSAHCLQFVFLFHGSPLTPPHFPRDLTGIDVPELRTGGC